MEGQRAVLNDNDLQDLKCPLTLDYFDDPVSVPCCGKAFSRGALVSALRSKRQCPVCKADLQQFDADKATPNRVLASLVAAVNRVPGDAAAAAAVDGWSATLTPLSSVGQLRVSLANAQVSGGTSLFVAIVDRSGSMSGRPWAQVQAALCHIAGLCRGAPSVKAQCIAYQSSAIVLPLQEQIIRTTGAGGGTNFTSAFLCLRDVLRQNPFSAVPTANTVTSATIAFLTDGQADDGGTPEKRRALAKQFTDVLRDAWPAGAPITVHAVGFGQNCDKDFLEMLRSADGTFRYAEPGEDDDSLCHKLTSLFEVAALSATIPVTFSGENLLFKGSGFGFERVLNVNFPVKIDRTGEASCWIKLDPEKPFPSSFVVNSTVDKDTKVEIIVSKSAESQSVAREAWLSQCADDVANEVLLLSKAGAVANDVGRLWCALLLQKIEVLLTHVQDGSDVAQRLAYLSEQAKQLRRGDQINLGKVSDLRFASKFASAAPKKITNSGAAPQAINSHAADDADAAAAAAAAGGKAIADKPRFVERAVFYSGNNASRERSPLQAAIFETACLSSRSDKLPPLLESCTADDVLFRDKDGNTALHLASYWGQVDVVTRLVAVCPFASVAPEKWVNNAGETPVTLAIKRRGYHRTLEFLLDHEFVIPAERAKALQEYCIGASFSRTAAFLQSLMETDNTVSADMKEEYIRFIYERAVRKNEDLDLDSFLRVCASKCMVDMVQVLLDRGAKPTIEVLLESCIPPKPDHPDVETYLKLAKMVLAKDPSLLHAVDPSTKESPLFRAADRGNLPHVKLFADMGAAIDAQSDLGNTPLWISCARRYPCIADELIARGADVNHINGKGNPPMYSIAQKGPLKMAETLLSNGARLDVVNQNGDTLILICCRNGQPDVLRLFLNYVDPDFVNFKAHIDGFNALFASVEANRPECIQVLVENDVKLDQWTDNDNAILPGATPLHLAAFYGRVDAARKLVSLGANINAVDRINGQTPLHVAVIQGQMQIVSLLRAAKADLSIRDRAGMTAVGYCKSAEAKEILVNPALSILMKLARGGFARDDVAGACDVLAQRSGVTGVLEAAQALDIPGPDGLTPFAVAVLFSNVPVVKALADLGCDRSVRNTSGVSLAEFTHWIGNPRVKALIPISDEASTRLQRLRDAYKGPAFAKVLFISPPPPDPALYVDADSTVLFRMSDAFLSRKDASAAAKQDRLELPSAVFRAKLNVLSHVLAEKAGTPSPLGLYALALFTDTPASEFSLQLNTAIESGAFATLPPVREHISQLLGLLGSLPAFAGECFVGVPSMERKSYDIGASVTFPGFLCASTLWRNAVENVPDFSTKRREGVVFIVKSQTGRFIGQWSSHPRDCEVVFAPFSRFSVSAWYYGDPICLAQANIREHTFRIRKEKARYGDGIVTGKNHAHQTFEEMMEGQKSLIVELQEIPRERTLLLE